MYDKYDIDRMKKKANEYKSVRRSFYDKKAEVRKHWYLILIGVIFFIAGFVGNFIAGRIGRAWPASLGNLVGIIGLFIVFKISGLGEYWSIKGTKRRLEEYLADDVISTFADEEEGK